MLATSPPELFELILFQEKLFGYACNLDTNDFEELSLKVYILSGCGPCQQSLTKSIGQISEVKLKGIGSLIVRHLFCLKPANHICCEFFGFRYTRYGTDGPQSAPYIYRWLKKGMERISDGQNGSAVLPAELMGPKVHRIYIDG